MAFTHLKDVYIDQLQDLFTANKLSLPVTQEMAELAKNPDLKAALQRGVEGIQQGKDVLNRLVRTQNSDKDPAEVFCKGMDGLVREAQAHALKADFENDDVRDAVIITQYQRMVHYAIAGYGCLAAFARRLGLEEDARVLQECLDNTWHGDKEMNRIAIAEVNDKAA